MGARGIERSLARLSRQAPWIARVSAVRRLITAWPRVPLVTYVLAAGCGLLFLYQASLSRPEQELFVLHWATLPLAITEPGLETLAPFPAVLTLLTSLFLHHDLPHLIGNLFYLGAFGPTVERTLGRPAFLGLYLLGGALANLAQVEIYPNSLVPMVGASGSIATLMAVNLVLCPRAGLRAILFTLWFAQELAFGLKMPHALDQWLGGTAIWAHVGGLILGILIGFGLRWAGACTACSSCRSVGYSSAGR